MGMHSAPSKMMGIPTYFVHAAIEEDAGGGNVLIRHFQRRKGLLIPTYDVVMASTDLFTTARRISEFAQTVFNNAELRGCGMKVH
jgi:hypothetical protein